MAWVEAPLVYFAAKWAPALPSGALMHFARNSKASPGTSSNLPHVGDTRGRAIVVLSKRIKEMVPNKGNPRRPSATLVYGRRNDEPRPKTGAVERPLGTKPVLGQRLGQFVGRGRAMVSGKLRGDRDEQDGREGKAPPARAAEIGHTMQTIP